MKKFLVLSVFMGLLLACSLTQGTLHGAYPSATSAPSAVAISPTPPLGAVRSAPVVGERDLCIVDTTALRVHVDADVESQTIGHVSGGDVLTVLDAPGDWIRVRSENGLDGWINGSYCEKEVVPAK